MADASITIRPADWTSFEAVMGDKGGCGGCWCMLWRRSKAEMDANMGAGNRSAMRSVFEDEGAPGLIAFAGEKAVGWIQVAPRECFPRMESSRVLKPVDDQPVWSISCFFIDKAYRKQGLSAEMLEAACVHVAAQGGTILEGYLIDTPKRSYPAVYAWTGFVGAFLKAGFQEAARRSETRPIMRRVLTAKA